MAKYMNLSENDREQFFNEIYDLASNINRKGLAYAEGIYDTLDILGLMPDFNEWVDEKERVDAYIEWYEAHKDMPCDYMSCCAGTDCPIFFECQS